MLEYSGMRRVLICFLAEQPSYFIFTGNVCKTEDKSIFCVGNRGQILVGKPDEREKPVRQTSELENNDTKEINRKPNLANTKFGRTQPPRRHKNSSQYQIRANTVF
jgi:hypothetical protein